MYHIDSVSLETLTTPPFHLLFFPPLLPPLFLISMSFMSFRSNFALLSTHFQVQRAEWKEKNRWSLSYGARSFCLVRQLVEINRADNVWSSDICDLCREKDYAPQRLQLVRKYQEWDDFSLTRQNKVISGSYLCSLCWVMSRHVKTLHRLPQLWEWPVESYLALRPHPTSILLL